MYQNNCLDFKNLQVDCENTCDAVGNCGKIMNIMYNSVALVRDRTIQTEKPTLVAEVCVNFFADRGCCVVSATDPYGRILVF
jgi:hypothetical protein